MFYKSMILEMINDQPELYEHLRSGKRLLPTVDTFAEELRISHQHWKEQIVRAHPGGHPSQIASEALELATAEIRSRLASAYPSDDTEVFSLDAAMAYLKATQPA